MNPEDTRTSTGARLADKCYSPFWAIWIVFVALALVQALYFADDLNTQARIEAAEAQFKRPLMQVQAVNQAIEAVSRDLVALAPECAEAGKIIAEFKINVTQPAKPAN